MCWRVPGSGSIMPGIRRTSAGFARSGRGWGPVDVALMPIGAYFPDSYRSVHTSPEEGLQGFVDVGARMMVPMHFGTFRLGREPMEEPPVRLMAEASRRGLEPRVKVLAEGETLLMEAKTDREQAGNVLFASASDTA